MSAPKPATPDTLPWVAEPIGISDYGEDVFDIYCSERNGALSKRITTVAGNDAAYIVHAANALPGLLSERAQMVAALRDIADADGSHRVSTLRTFAAQTLRAIGEA